MFGRMVKPSGQIEIDARTRILDAADAVFVRHGIDGARMQEIADQAQVNKALLHYYFRSKADLAKAVWLRIASSFAPGVFQMLASEISLDEKIDRLVEAYYGTLTKHPYLLVYVVSEAARHPKLVEDFYTPERKLAAKGMIATLRRQLEEKARAENSVAPSAEQFLVTLLASCLFPFLARPMLTALLGLSPDEFNSFIDKRKRDLPLFFKRALQQ
jgi:AcrR family transcriptional regulator